MSDLLIFVSNWGYLALIFGACINSEPILICVGFLVFTKNIFNILLCIMISTLASISFSFFCFYFGKIYSKQIKSLEYVKNSLDFVDGMLKTNDVFFILFFRFIYGIKLVSPFILGCININCLKFFTWNVIASFCWVLSMFLISYILTLLTSEFSVSLMTMVYVLNIVIPFFVLSLYTFLKKILLKH